MWLPNPTQITISALLFKSLNSSPACAWVVLFLPKNERLCTLSFQALLKRHLPWIRIYDDLLPQERLVCFLFVRDHSTWLCLKTNYTPSFRLVDHHFPAPGEVIPLESYAVSHWCWRPLQSVRCLEVTADVWKSCSTTIDDRWWTAMDSTHILH